MTHRCLNCLYASEVFPLKEDAGSYPQTKFFVQCNVELPMLLKNVLPYSFQRVSSIFVGGIYDGETVWNNNGFDCSCYEQKVVAQFDVEGKETKQYDVDIKHLLPSDLFTKKKFKID